RGAGRLGRGRGAGGRRRRPRAVRERPAGPGQHLDQPPQGLGACLVAGPDSAAGCDLELVEPRDGALARHFFTPAERALVDRSGHPGRDLAVALVWSAKESALKALRQGLRVDVREVEVTLDPDLGTGPTWRPLAVRSRGVTFSGWWRLRGRHVLTAVIEPPTPPPVSLGV